MKTIRCANRFLTLLLVMMMCTAAMPVRAQSILNPFYTDPAWKLWYENNTPVGGLTPPAYANWLFPDDADTIAYPGRFLKYNSTDWPQRKYAGFWYDAYSSL